MSAEGPSTVRRLGQPQSPRRCDSWGMTVTHSQGPRWTTGNRVQAPEGQWWAVPPHQMGAHFLEASS